MSGPSSARNSGVWIAALLLTLLGAAVAIQGWRLLWFYTDDAFISFRYVSNWMAGYGLVWNPPPFHPVEGYSNFLWIVLLALVWKIFGVQPPDAANLLLLGMGLGILALLALRLWKALSTEPPASRLFLFAVALALLVTNRTFLTWMSSGLETSLFSLLFLWWCCEILTPPEGKGLPPAFLRCCVASTGMALTRPDGLVYWGITLVVLGSMREFRKDRTHLAIAAICLLPVPAHFLWRYSYYGDWLPNTYYAKVVDAWPAMGLRYLASFILEYAWYVPLLTLAPFLFTNRKMIPALRSPGLAAVVTGIAIEVGYYTIRVGGDHFEYRVLHHLIPIAILGFTGILIRATWPAPVKRALVLIWLGMSLLLPWTHWALTNDLLTRRQTENLFQPVAPVLPSLFRPLAGTFDALQQELIAHSICIRHQEHKVFYLQQVAIYPAREEGQRIRWSERNIMALPTVGVPGWVYPETAIIDIVGLNDRLLARAPVPAGQFRYMAHERLASPDYVRCYQPNLMLDPENTRKLGMARFEKLPAEATPGFFGIRFTFLKREAPRATDAQIRECESRNWPPDSLLIPVGF